MKRCALLLVLAGLALSLAAAALAATTAEEVELSHSLSTSLVTPHMDWGHGYVRGPIRVLFFLFSGSYGGEWDEPGTRLREAIELLERFDVKGDAVFYGNSGSNWMFHGHALGEARAERLLKQHYDLYVIGGFPFEKLPPRMQYEIMKPVSEGAGLLCCGQGAGEFMTAKRKLSPLATFLSDGLPYLDGKALSVPASTYRLGKGRGVWLNYSAWSLTPNAPFSYRGLQEYEYRMLLLGRAGLWAAGRENAIEVTSALGNQPLVITRAPKTPASVVLTNRGTGTVPVTAHLQLRRADDGKLIPLGAMKADLLPERATTLDLALPLLRDGDYFLDVTVRSKRGLEAFGAGSLTVQSPAGLEKITLDRSFIEQGETIQGEVALRGVPAADSLLRVRFRDSYDRVLKQQDLKLTTDQARYPFTYKADADATILMRAEAALVSGGDEVEVQSASFTVPKRRHGQFNFVMWDTPRDVLGYYAWRQMQEAGQYVCLQGSMGAQPTPQIEVLKACDVSLVPYSTRIQDPKDANGVMQPMCWNDEPAVTEYVNKIVNNQALLREQGVFVYSLGDEGVTKGCCVAPSCLDAYRKWLQGQYGTIDKLNASWGSQYGSFAEVNLLDTKDNMENGAIKTAPARWYDRQAFARYNLMQFVKRFRLAYEKLDPLSQTGFEGTGGFGDDYDAMMADTTFYGPYPSIGDDVLRSAYPRDRVRSNWMGYSKTGEALSDAAWRMVMKGMDSIWYWMWDGVGSFWGYLKPSLDFYPATADVTREMTPVRHGLGDLMLKSQMLNSGIAVFYSLPSALGNSLENGRDYQDPELAHKTWTQLTYELGLDYRYLTSKLLTGGALTNSEFKLLVLPSITALTAEEAQAIRRFAEGGGTVVADVRPGLFDGHCKPVTPGLLDDLFGIKRTGRGKGTTAAVKVTLEGGKSLEWSQTRVDTEVEAAGAKAFGLAGDKPVYFVNPVGKGRAILLNFQLNAPKTADPMTAASRDLLAALCKQAGVGGPVTITAPDGGPLPACEPRVWGTGDGLLIGVWRHMENAWFDPRGGTSAGAPQAARLRFAAPRYVYDLRQGKFLGQVTQVDTKLAWGRANFFLALPYEIKGVSASLAGNAAPGQKLTVTFKLQGPAKVAERHALWVQVTDPAGNAPQWGGRVVLLDHGAGQLTLPVAYNDAPGKWKLRATELFSGKSTEVTWTPK